MIAAEQIMGKFKSLTVRELTGGLFPIKTFVMTLALLILLFILSIGIYQLMFAVPVVDPMPTGKVMAIIEVEKKIVEQPIQHLPTPDIHESSPTSETTQAAETPEVTIEDSIAGLSEDSPFGSLPIIRTSDGLKSSELLSKLVKQRKQWFIWIISKSKLS